jgi:hypothetical protein
MESTSFDILTHSPPSNGESPLAAFSDYILILKIATFGTAFSIGLKRLWFLHSRCGLTSMLNTISTKILSIHTNMNKMKKIERQYF